MEDEDNVGVEIDSTEDEQSTEELEQSTDEGSEQEGQEPPGDEPAEEEVSDDEGVTVSFGDEQEQKPKEGTDLVRHLRETLRAKEKRLADLERENQTLKPKTEEVVGPKPTLEGCDYDADRFEAELLAWNKRKHDSEQKLADDEKRKQAEREEWDGVLQKHAQGVSALKVKDYTDAEDVAKATFSQIQQNLILSAADDSALMVYALGKNVSKAQELASITNPVKFVKELTKLELKLKTTPKKQAPLPERSPRGSAQVAGTTDAKLAQLEREAERTGDRTALIQYRSSLKKRA